MPGAMSGNSISSMASFATSSSAGPLKRSSLCSSTPVTGTTFNDSSVAPQHRRSSLQQNSVSKISFKDFFFKDKKDSSKTQEDPHRSNSKISGSEDKLVVVQSAAESGCASASSSSSRWSSQCESDSTSHDRPRTPSDEHRILIPDSTTSQLEGKQSYSSGDDVLVKQKDGRYYLGTVMRSSPGGERWLVRFGDETERWAGGCDLRPLDSGSDGGEGSVLCVVCKVRGASGEVVACDHCGRGYHRGCHSPDDEAMSPPTNYVQGVSWQCKRCVEQRFKVAASENRAMKREMLKRQVVRQPQKLLYNLSSLHWDTYHRENTENQYCYCGTPGIWFKKMLQCVRCRQWFHQKCVACLRHPLYTGDRFYIFACSVCNFGTEFLRRIELDWVDLVHLMLFNLTMFNSKKYYDLDAVIIPYIMDNWYALQLPEKMQAMTPAQRREQIVEALSSSGNRFKCGRETKKRASIWGLRTRDPPSPQPLSSPLPSRGPVTEAMLASRVPLIPELDSPSSSSQDSTREHRMIVPIDHHWMNVVSGRRFQDNSISSDNDSMRSSPSPVDDILSRHRMDPDSCDIFNSKKDISSFNLSKNNEELSTPPVVKRKELKLYEMDYQGFGFVKKSVPFPKLTLNKRKKFLDSLKQRCKSKEKEEIESESNDCYDKSTKLLRTRLSRQQKPTTTVKTHTSIGTNTPPVEDETVFTLIETRTGNLVKSKLECEDAFRYSDDKQIKNDVALPPTPPTSVSAPPTPPANSGGPLSSSCSSNDIPPDFHHKQQNKSIQYDSDQEKSKTNKSDTCCENNIKIPTSLSKSPSKNKIKDSPSKKEKCETTAFHNLVNNSRDKNRIAINLEISKLSTKNIIEHSKIMSLHHINDPYLIYKVDHDSSGDDTSSRGTLDSIIPPPVNFQGKNNPFHWQANTNRRNLAIANKKRHSLSKLQTNTINGSLNNQRISLPINLNPVVVDAPMRTLKRHLSEKDLVIGPNGEVKRRRLRRSRKVLQNATITQNQNAKEQIMTERQKTLRSSLGQDDNGPNKTTSGNQQQSNTTYICAEETVQQMNGCVDFIQNGRTLRQRQERNYCDSRRGSTSSNSANNTLAVASSNNLLNPGVSSSGVRSLNLSPQKMAPFKNNNQSNSATTCGIDDLKNSVHSYFGAMNRINAGEKYTLIGKRLMENGSVQYLIEWEGHGS